VQKLTRFLVWSLVVVAAVVGALRATAIRWWQVPPTDTELGASIAPTLRAGDWVLSWRLTKPGLGSLVQCPEPDDASAIVIGRIVAREGQTVSLLGPDLRVDGKAYPIEYNCTEKKLTVISPDTLKPVELACDMEDIAGRLHMRAHGVPETTPRPFQAMVPSGEVFLASDNRVHPFDSRHFGTLPEKGCRESVFFRLVSRDGFFDVEHRLDYIR